MSYTGDLVPIPGPRDKWLLYRILEDEFWGKAEKEPVATISPFENIVDEDKEEEGITHYLFLCTRVYSKAMSWRGSLDKPPIYSGNEGLKKGGRLV